MSTGMPEVSRTPWSYRRVGTRRDAQGVERAVYDVHDGKGAIIAGCLNESDARMIALAPRLFVALENFLNAHIRHAQSGDAGQWDPEQDQEVIIARSALAAAGAK